MFTAMALLMPASAGAIQRTATKMSIAGFAASSSATEWIVTGKLKSPHSTCVRARKLALAKQGEATQARVTSTRAGGFSLRIPMEGNLDEATYFVRVARKKISGGTRLCRAGKAQITATADSMDLQMFYNGGGNSMRLMLLASAPESACTTPIPEGMQWWLYRDGQQDETWWAGSFTEPSVEIDLFELGAQAGTYVAHISAGSTGRKVAGGGYDVAICRGGESNSVVIDENGREVRS